MLITNLYLENFRNYNKLNITVNDMLIVLLGENAQGKTNLLESIYYLSRGTAYRPNRDKELVKWNENYFKIMATVKREELDYTVKFHVDAKGKSLLVNGVKRSRIGEASDYFNTVIFAPEDLKILKGGPSDRRSYLDSLISQINPQYNYYLSQYNKVLFQRNNILKDLAFRKGNEDLLQIWDSQIAHYGSRVLVKRVEGLQSLRGIAQSIHSSITSSQEVLDISYSSSLIGDNKPELEKTRREFENMLLQSRKLEFKKGTTVVGPHRDDFIIQTNNREVKVYGSQGQQRTCVLSLKLAELELIKEVKGSYPLLLLDDVMSELDHNRRKYLLKLTAGKVQTLITTTDLNSIPEEIVGEATIFKVKSGSVENLKNQ